MKKLIGFAAASLAALSLSILPAAGDTIYIDLTVSTATTALEFDLKDGIGQTKTVTLDYNETNGTIAVPDASGCNLGGSGSFVEFNITPTTVSGSPASLDKAKARFENCGASVVITVTATAVGVTTVSLTNPVATTNKSPLNWDVSGAAFAVTVVDTSAGAPACNGLEVAVPKVQGKGKAEVAVERVAAKHGCDV
jgi:hypothetical protein